MSSFVSTVRRAYSNRNFLALNLADVLFLLGGNLWWSFQPLYVLALGASKEELGILVMFGLAAMLVPQIPGGILSDRLSKKKIILFGAALRLVPPIIFFLANNWVHLFPGVFINSIASIDIPAWNALLAESTSEETRGTAYSIYGSLTSISCMSTTIGGVIMDSIGVVSGTRICLLFNEALLLVYTTIICRFVKEQKTHLRGVSMNRRVAVFLDDLKNLPRKIEIVIISIGLCSFASGLCLSYMVVYATEVIGLTNTQWGMLETVVSLIATTLSTPAGFLSDRIGRKFCILTSMFIWAISIFLFINSSNFTLAFLARLLEGVGYGFGGLVTGFVGGSAWQSLIADSTPKHDLGKVMGLIGAFTIAFNSFAPFVSGYFYNRYSPTLPFQLNIVITMTSAVIVLLLLRDAKRKRNRNVASML
ncbi:MAG: MFS transporter [Candidatus Bathyarchaeia archaeon]